MIKTATFAKASVTERRRKTEVGREEKEGEKGRKGERESGGNLNIGLRSSVSGLRTI